MSSFLSARVRKRFNNDPMDPGRGRYTLSLTVFLYKAVSVCVFLQPLALDTMSSCLATLLTSKTGDLKNDRPREVGPHSPIAVMAVGHPFLFGPNMNWLRPYRRSHLPG